MLCDIVVEFSAGSEGAKREQGDHTGAEQHFSTSGQS